MGGDVVKNHSRKCLRRNSLNDIVSTQPMSETTTVNKPFLPEEIIVEILLRLPVISLLQFKCVCKTWKTLISDPQFAKSHILSSTPSLQLISKIVAEKCKFVSYPLKPLLENPSTPVKPYTFETTYHTRIVGSCNGLLCLHDFSQSNFSLWNPSINFQSKSFPGFVCFHHNLFTYCGFGYDQLNDKYKVLAVVQNKFNLKETVTKIYTFGENSWTTIQNFPGDWQRGYSSRWRWLGKFVSGTLNWIVNNQKVIISFDLEKETYEEMLLPQHDGDNVCNPVLYVSNNCICVSFDHSKESSWVMWMMKEYGVVESWTKLMIIPQHMLVSDIHRRPLSDALFISENGVLLLRPNNSNLEVHSLNNNGGLDYWSRIFGKFVYYLQIYQESLVSLQW